MCEKPENPELPLPVKRVPSMARIREIQAFVASLPIRDTRTPEEMLYDENGLPI